ncbi:secretin N-terminal domain-containing protein [Sodalis glossinidius]|uniref:secretin N-terminal domain-containing protein n=1 Tax=Sodalis glossinidius TaxID=63612 RepID=UPI001FB32705|nr:secretin N-terminal domain-containing protein [Sodalis glossinidius]
MAIGTSAAAADDVGAAVQDPFQPSSPGSSQRESAGVKAGLPADMPPSTLFSLRRGAASGTLTLRADDAPVLQALASLRGLNLVVTPGVEGEITLRLYEMPWRQVLELVLTAGGLQQTRQGRTLVVSLQEERRMTRGRKKPRRRRGGEGVPLVNRLITLQYADAAEVGRSIDAQRSSLLSPRGSVRLDKRTNSLVLRDIASALAAVGDWIAVWDVPLEQVLITAHIVTISRENLREVGVNWRYPAESAQADARTLVKMPVGGHLARIGLPLARLNGRMLELTALEQENKVDILASPWLLLPISKPPASSRGRKFRIR